jgi:hypothetical protein
MLTIVVYKFFLIYVTRFFTFLKKLTFCSDVHVRIAVFVLAQERDLGDEYGWKQVHGDVFRPASHSMLFSALVGAGYQVTVVVLSVIIFAILGELYTE